MPKITVNQPVNDNMGASFEALTSFLHQVNKAENEKELTFDLSNVRFAYPFFLLPLAAIINNKKQAGINVKVNLNANIQEYFDYLFFPYGLNPANNNQWQEKLKNYSYKTYLPVCAVPTRTISSPEREHLLTAFSKTLTNQLNLTGSIISVLSYLLTEAIDNITDHANIDNGWLMVQNYPRKGFLDICITDTGDGILKTYMNTGHTDINTDTQALNNALNGKSTKNNKERGFGISTSRRMLVKGLGGKYFLFSGSAFYIWTKSHEAITEISNSLKWKGTMVALRIPKEIPKDFDLYQYLE